MSKPFEWKDFSKKYNDLSSNNFPTFSKTKQVQDTLKFKFSSKAQQGVKFDSSVTNTDSSKTEADFSAKININELKGVELGFKAKSKPSVELSAKFDDKIIPLEGASVTIKEVATAPNEQTIGLSVGFANQYVNLNLGFNYPLSHRLFDFLDAATEDKDPLAEQRPKIDVDFVAKPVSDYDVYIGGNANITLPKASDELLYNSKLAAALNNKTFNGGAFIEHKKEKKEETVEGKTEEVVKHSTKFGLWAYTEVDDLSGGAQVTYSPSESTKEYKGFAFEAIAGLQRDADSKLSSKVQIIPDTTVSLGYEQKLSPSVKASFGYAFLLNKTTSESKTKASAYNFGLEISH